MKIKRRNAVLCLLWVMLVLSIPIYVFWTIFNYEHLCSWSEKKVLWFFKKSNNSKTMDEKK